MRLLTVIVSFLLFTPSLLTAQITEPQEKREIPIQKGRDNEWYKQIQSARVAFISSALSLTPKESEEFWPLYNSFWREREMEKVKSKRALKVITQQLKNGQAIEDNKMRELILLYISRGEMESRVYKKYLPQFLKVISVEKMAKLIRAEEDFRAVVVKQLQSAERTTPPPPPAHFQSSKMAPKE